MPKDTAPGFGERVAGALWVMVLLGLSTCTIITPQQTATPATLRFDEPLANIEDGLHVTSVDNEWDGYGEAVDVRGDVGLIGASDWNTDREGSAYVYRLSPSGGEWQEEAVLTPSDGLEWAQRQTFSAKRFGSAVAIGEGVIAIGAPGTDSSVGGAVYIYEYDGQAWVETARLRPEGAGGDTAERDVSWVTSARMPRRTFGASVALDGNILAVSGDAETRSVYVFERDDSGWQQQATIGIPGQPERDLYMVSMDLFGDTLALSAYYVPAQTAQREMQVLLTGKATVFLFEQIDGRWQESLRFEPQVEGVDLLFLRGANIGASVALGGVEGRATLLAVGLPGFPDLSGFADLRDAPMFVGQGEHEEPIPGFPPPAREVGTVTLFERGRGGDWQQQATLIPAIEGEPPGPGFAFSEDPRDMFSPENIASVVYPGHVYSEAPEISFFGATVDLDGEQLAVTSGYANVTHVFKRRNGEWIYSVRIKPWDGELVEDYAQVVAISGETLLLGTPGEFGDSAYFFELPAGGPP